MVLFVDQHDAAGRPQGKGAAKLGDGPCRGRRTLDPAHHASGGQGAHPADIARTFDRLAAQVKPPGREGIAERLSHDGRRDQRGRNRRARQREVVRRLQHQHRHGHRPADHRHGKSRHADERRILWIDDRRPDHQADQIGIDMAKQAAEEQRGEEQAAAKTETQRHDRRRALHDEDGRQKAERQAIFQVEMQRPVPRRQHLRRQPGERDEKDAAQDRPPRRRDRQATGERLHLRHRAHQHDAQPCGHGAQPGIDQVMMGQHRLARHGVDEIGLRAQHLRDQHAGQRGGGHRRDGGGRISADDDLEGVEGPGQRRTKGPRDRRPRPRPDQYAQVAAPQPQPAAGDRGQPRPQLCIGRLQPDRCAEAVGEDRLAGNH